MAAATAEGASTPRQQVSPKRNTIDRKLAALGNAIMGMTAAQQDQAAPAAQGRRPSVFKSFVDKDTVVHLEKQVDRCEDRARLAWGPMRPPNRRIKLEPELEQALKFTAHWLENPTAFDQMKAITFHVVTPALQQRLTQFNGTRVPVLVAFSLTATEVGRMATLDTFWKRIVGSARVWRGIQCRDYDCRGRLDCMWRTLQAGDCTGPDKQKACLYHLGDFDDGAFSDACRAITAIPGRSKEELLRDYNEWRKLKVPSQQQQQQQNGEQASSEGGGRSSIRKSSTAAVAASPRKKPWQLQAHCHYGLPVKHARQSPRIAITSPVGRSPAR